MLSSLPRLPNSSLAKCGCKRHSSLRCNQGARLDGVVSSIHVQQNGLLTHPQDLDGPLRVAAQRKINAYRQQYADNQNISFLPAIVSTSCRMHGEFLRPIFLQAHRETEAHFNAAGMSSQNYQTDSVTSAMLSSSH